MTSVDLHHRLDWDYGENGDSLLNSELDAGADPNARGVETGEALLHVATRRRRLGAVQILHERGADLDLPTNGGKTAYAHAARRGFEEICSYLRDAGADTTLNEPDQFAVAVVAGRLDEARAMLQADPSIVRTGNPEEDRLLADVAGRREAEPVELLIGSGADLSARGLDDGTPLHQAAWFGQPGNAKLLVNAGAPLDIFDSVHFSSPLGWAVHGSRYSGGAEGLQAVYGELVQLLLDAGSSLCYPDSEDGAYLTRLREDATPLILELLPQQP